MVSIGVTIQEIMDQCFRVFLAEPEHLRSLPEIERAAVSIFPKAVLSNELSDHTTPIAEFEAARARGHLQVAVTQDGHPVGFAMVADHGTTLHLEEVDVHPQFQKQGIGTALIDAVCQFARDSTFQGVSLTTFSTIPWNAPRYQKLGFRILQEDELTEELKAILQDEANRGLDPKIRVAMYMELAS